MASPASAHSLPGHTNGAELPSASPCSTLRHLARLLLGPVPRALFVLPGVGRCLCLCGVPWHRLLEVRRQQAMSVPPGAPGPAPCTRSVPTSPCPPCRMSSAFVAGDAQQNSCLPQRAGSRHSTDVVKKSEQTF